MPAMASVETMARSQQELLEAGRAKLARFKERSNKNKNRNKNTSPKQRGATTDAKINVNGNPKADSSSEVFASSHPDVITDVKFGREDAHSNGIVVDQPCKIEIEPVVKINEQVVADQRGQFVLSDISKRFENDDEGVRKQLEAEELRRKGREAEEASRKEREDVEQEKQLVIVERITRIEHEAEERKQKQREAEEAKRKEREDAEDARRQALIAEFALRKEREAEEAKRKEREAEEMKRRQLFIAEVSRRKQREAEENKRKEREAEENMRKEYEANEVRRKQREEEEARKKEREDFSGLEQHIQDLTEEKFALHRELAKARAMTEEFVSEHSALVENFNHQGQLVNQLTEDIEQLQERMKEREAFIMALVSERDRARQDSEAAREQSQTMAGEVIVLENRIRTLRSHELKMEKDVSNFSSEMESLRKQAANWEQDRAHLQTLIDALQEEKKVLQVRLRKVASGEREFTYRSENSEAVQLRQRVLADASTSTDDLPPSPLKIHSDGPSTPLDSPSLDSQHPSRRFEEPLFRPITAHSSQHRLTTEFSVPPVVGPALSSFMYPPSPLEAGSSSLPALTGDPQSGRYQSIELPASCISIPADLMRTINNINDIIASLGEERIAIVKALKAESKGAAELRVLNADLSRKLEATTQQLELVVAQRMADGSSTGVPTASRNAGAAALDYVDEGDEVVERVFTWIMQLFPNRTSRRNGVKRL